VYFGYEDSQIYALLIQKKNQTKKGREFYSRNTKIKRRVILSPINLSCETSKLRIGNGLGIYWVNQIGPFEIGSIKNQINNRSSQ